jgi:hypothetical protein
MTYQYQALRRPSFNPKTGEPYLTWREAGRRAVVMLSAFQFWQARYSCFSLFLVCLLGHRFRSDSLSRCLRRDVPA